MPNPRKTDYFRNKLYLARSYKSRVFRAGIVLALCIFAVPALAFAQYDSPNYSIDEVFIGGGGEIDSCSTAYCADQILGGTAVGDTNSTNFRAQGGFGTPGDPTLAVDVTNTSIDLGVLNESTTAAESSNFSVSNYLSNGYVVRIYGNTPTNYTGAGTHSLTALNSPSLSVPGTEQFGINLVANTTPGIGANPSQAPDSTFSFGEAATGYDTQDYFKYVDEDVIAESNSSSGETNYTISIIANVSTNTPGGQYITTLVIQAIATF
jgi:hypothetical protein